MRNKSFGCFDKAKAQFKKLISTDSRLSYLLRRGAERLAGNGSNYRITELSEWLELPAIALKIWLSSIPDGYEYESFKIKKKSGRGLRSIDAPNHNLKVLQRSIYHKLLKRLNLHQSATAYISGKSIFDNALPHIRQHVVVNIDLKDFFGSISSNRIYRYWRFLGWDVETSTILRNICCHNGSLPQGSPTSPALSNLCNQLLDTRLEGVARIRKGQYTRYSDDLTFSFPNDYGLQSGILRKIRQILVSEGYGIQEKKRIRVQRSHQRQATTGLIVNEKINLPRETRKRIRSMRYHLSKNTLSATDIQRLNGWESLLQMVDKVNAANPPKRVELNRLVKGLTAPLPDVKKILFLASSPSDKDRLRLDVEANEIDESLRRSNNRDQFNLQKKWAISATSLRRALIDVKPQIVHFSGHGLGIDGIVVEDDRGNSKTISTETLASLFKLCADHVECVLLNACYSEVQAIAISKNINYVIGMSHEIGDRAAIKFATGFYDALGAGSSVEVAYRFGCNAIQLESISEHSVPQIKKKSQGGD